MSGGVALSPGSSPLGTTGTLLSCWRVSKLLGAAQSRTWLVRSAQQMLAFIFSNSVPV